MNSFFTFFKESSILNAILAMVIFIFNLMTSYQVDKISEIYKILKSENNIIFENAVQANKIEKIAPIITENFDFYPDVSALQNRQESINNIDASPGTFSRKLANNSLAVFVLKNEIDETAF
jgi:hypothetical protein